MDFTDEYEKDLFKSKFKNTTVHVFNVISENSHCSQVLKKTTRQSSPNTKLFFNFSDK